MYFFYILPPLDLFDFVRLVGDDPVAAHQLDCFRAFVRDPNGVGEEPARRFGVGMGEPRGHVHAHAVGTRFRGVDAARSHSVSLLQTDGCFSVPGGRAQPLHLYIVARNRMSRRRRPARAPDLW